MQISKRARQAVFAKLQASFNTTLAGICSRDGIAGAFALDFASVPKSVNVFLGQVDPAILPETTAVKWPLMVLYTASSANQNLSKPSSFDGSVTVVADVVLSWKNSGANVDFDALGDAVEETLVTCLNGNANQNFGVNVMYTGRIACQRTPVRQGGESWYQLLRFTLPFEVVA